MIGHSRLARVAKAAAVPILKRFGWKPRSMRMPHITIGDRLTAADVPTRVTIRSDRTLLVNDRPFFPNGLYYAREEIADLTGSGLARLKAAGFNLLFFDGDLDAGADLDRIWQAGLHVWFRPPGELHRHFSDLKRLVTAFGRHPAVLFWEMDDEPLLNGANWDDAVIGSRVVRALDPYHLVLCNQWYSGDESDASLRRWSELSDVHSFGAYPVPLARWGRRTRLVDAGWPDSIAVVGAHVDKWLSIAPTKPVIAVLQAFAPNALEDGIGGFPTPAQSRFMAYHAVIRGANGLHHFGVPNPTTPHVACGVPPAITADLDAAHLDFLRARDLNAEFWRSHFAVVAEIARMANVFTSRDATWQASSGPDGVECRVKQYGDDVVLLVANATSTATTTALGVQPLAGCAVHDWNNPRAIAVGDHGILDEEIEPYGVRVYSTRAIESESFV